MITYSISLRRIDTENMNKNMPTYTYKKLNDIITAKHEYSQESDTLLLYNDRPVFFGLEDSDKKYEGNLTQTTYTISSDCDGCYAITIDGEPGTS